MNGGDMELAVPADVPRRAFTRAEFDKMVELGFFEGERVELLYGQVVTMTIGPPHAHLVAMLNRLLILALRDRATLRPQSPIAASDVSEPEPDLAVVPNGRYVEDHPPRALWILEVSDSTLHKDRTVKARLYAETGVPEYWVVDVEGEAVEVYTQPSKGRYQSMTRLEAGATASSEAFPDIKIAIDALFG